MRFSPHKAFNSAVSSSFSLLLMGTDGHSWAVLFQDLKTGYDVSSFIRDYLSIKQQRIPNIRKVYPSFKEFVGFDSDCVQQELLEDLMSYARDYEKLLLATTGNAKLDACIRGLNLLETSVTRPFLLEVMREYRDNKLDMNTLVQIFAALLQSCQATH